MLRKKWFWILIVLVVAAGGAGAAYARRGDAGITVTVETIQKRDLEAIVSASGKIEPKKTVNISAQTMGRVTRLGVQEGDRVRQGQFLLQIDPVTAEAAVRRDIAAVAGARTSLEQSKAALQSARANLELARQNLKRQQELWSAGLTTRESLERAQSDVEVRDSDLKAREQEIKTRETQLNQQEAGLASSRHTLAQVRFEAPFDGIVTRRNVEEGENVVVGTMNNAGTVLLTVADMSVIEAEVEVDETDIPFVQLGQRATIAIDAIADKKFTGYVTEIGNSPIQTAGSGTTRTATNFKVTVTIEGQIPEVRPGFTCTAEITTATRKQVVSVPIQALTVRELLYDAQGNVVHEQRPPRPRFRFGPPRPAPVAAPVELKPGEKREEVEGVFLLRDNKAAFTTVKTGIAGERYLEILSGLKEGDVVITGPFESVRGMYEGDLVKIAPRAGAAAK
ncbi:MAG TPA: efflux RND transporter periplasmic adaptor subunit [Vicinamibacterales bacterium]|nr:efflux RND transporter periplasmic adaptor subunit [Vicinamibacterales bacterium]